jgi:aspartate/methionine/tyrosine aminotransferase
MFNNRLDQVSTPASVAIADRVRLLTAEGKQIAKMQTGEPSFATPRYIIESAYEAMLNGHTHYAASQGIPELRRSISSWYEEEFHITAPPLENIIITNGAIHAIFSIISILLNPGDEVIIPEPYWPQYGHITLISGGVICNVDTRANDARLTLELLEGKITPKSKLLIINNPCNPTGIVYSQDEIESFLEIATRHNLFVLFDEVYSRLPHSDKFCSVFSAKNYNKCKDNIIYVNSFSKAFAMTGWRVGYSVIPDVLVKKVLTISQNSLTSVSTFSQYAATLAIEKQKENEDSFLTMSSCYQERFQQIRKILIERNIEFIEPEGAFYFFIKCETPSKEFVLNLLEKENIAVVPGAAYGEFFDDFYRISYAVDENSMNSFLNWLKSN